MGHGIALKCKCNTHYIHLGVGMMYPQVFFESLQDARNGKLGEDIQKATEGKQYLAIDAESKFYYCTECGYWEVNGANDLYEPKNTEAYKLVRFGEKTIEEWGEIPYAFGNDFKDYNLLFKYKHTCPKCGTEMKNPKTIGKRVLSKIRCQECGGKMEEDGLGMIMWD